MSLAKLNVLHIHLSDDDSLNLELPSFPGIVEYAALKKNQIYTAQDMRDIVHYASVLGIKVIPEIDVPGHSLAFA